MPVRRLARGIVKARRPARGAVAKVTPKFKPRAKKPGVLGKAVGLAKKYPKTAAAAAGVATYKAGKSAGERKERKRRRR